VCCFVQSFPADEFSSNEHWPSAAQQLHLLLADADEARLPAQPHRAQPSGSAISFT
jgi:hypothetical protein